MGRGRSEVRGVVARAREGKVERERGQHTSKQTDWLAMAASARALRFSVSPSVPERGGVGSRKG